MVKNFSMQEVAAVQNLKSIQISKLNAHLFFQFEKHSVNVTEEPEKQACN